VVGPASVALISEEPGVSNAGIELVLGRRAAAAHRQSERLKILYRDRAYKRLGAGMPQFPLAELGPEKMDILRQRQRPTECAI
jgi:hypothetical protein